MRVPTQVCVMLAPRCAEVLDELMTDGPTNRQIGRRLYISEDTVKTHMKRIFARLPQEYRDRTALALGVERGLIVVKVMTVEQAHRSRMSGRRSLTPRDGGVQSSP